jgi:hypothetical protein
LRRKARTVVKMAKGIGKGKPKHEDHHHHLQLTISKLEFLKKLSSKANELQTHLFLEPISPFMPQTLI